MYSNIHRKLHTVDVRVVCKYALRRRSISHVAVYIIRHFLMDYLTILRWAIVG